MTRPLVLLGGGGHAKVVAETALSQGNTIIGYTDLELRPDMTRMFGLRYLGTDEIFACEGVTDIYLLNGMGSVGKSLIRAELFVDFNRKGYKFATVVHSSAIVSPRSNISEGVQIMAGAVIQSGTVIGRNSIVNTGSKVDHDCRIGEHVHIAPGVTICGNVTVGDRVHIGAGSTVIQGITIGENSIVGAGAVILNDIPPNTLVVGVPGKEVKRW
ncbi:acetyltransferase [Paenibacillus thermotolerans]|uniref:acetyltransferase n=1 Tax=Paenibacillus thermotolerans TaxID=3027807 RepID=UPI002368E929|nr:MULTISPECIES: acetyltransferase [unclassified Paenibacillus]